MIWLGIHFPSLALDVFLRARAGDPALPAGTLAAVRALAVCEDQRLLQACPLAQQQGVHAGMKRATALALLPDLLLRERDPRLELDALQQAAGWALQFTPSVSLQFTPSAGLLPVPPAARRASGLLLEIEPSVRLFGGREPLIARLRSGLSDLGFTTRVACAPTATGAWLMARHQDGLFADGPAMLNARLSCVPVGLLDTARPHADVLESLGAHSLKQLVQLPRAGVARRFGRSLLTELDRAFGRVPEPREWFEAPAVFQSRLELLAQVEDTQALLFGARRLILALCGWLGARHAAARCIELLALHDDIAPTVIELQPADPTRDADRLVLLLREKLAVTRLRAPAHTLQLACHQVVVMAAVNATLFPLPASAREGLGRLIERLQARLGHDRVLRLLPVADHRPESAYRLASATVDSLVAEPAPMGRTATPAPGIGMDTGSSTGAGPHWGALPRPLWMLEKPQALTERNNRPYGHGPLTLLAGPERIESGWWDSRLVQRDYFIASDESDMLLWIYRERLPEAGARHGWFLQGRFG